MKKSDSDVREFNSVLLHLLIISFMLLSYRIEHGRVVSHDDGLVSSTVILHFFLWYPLGYPPSNKQVIYAYAR